MELVASRSRKEAINEGILVDVSDYARKVGLSLPVAMTKTVWIGYVIAPPELKEFEDSEARVLTILKCLVVEAQKTDRNRILFGVKVKTGLWKQETLLLKAICSPGDCEQPVITIMLPEEQSLAERCECGE